MFDFLYSEEWWMNTIIGAAIAGACAIIGSLVSAFFAYHYTLRQIKDKVEAIAEHKDLTKEHERLSKEHEGLSKEHEGLSKEHRNIEKNIEAIQILAQKVNENIIDMKASDQKTLDGLTDRQKLILESVNNLKNFADEMKLLLIENQSLKEKNQRLEKHNITLQTMVQMQDRGNYHNTDDYELER